MVCLSLPVVLFALVPAVLAEQSADTVTLVQHAVRSTEDTGEMLASPLVGLLGTMHLEAALRSDFLSPRGSDVGDTPEKIEHAGEGDVEESLKSILAIETGDIPVATEQKCTAAERKSAEEETKKMVQKITAKNGTGLQEMLPPSCTSDMIWGQMDIAKIVRVDADAYGLCVQQLTGVTAKCSECMVDQVQGYQSCSQECSGVQAVCNTAIQTFSRPYGTVWPLQQMATGASLRSCSMATATCARCTVKKLKNYVDCTGAFNGTQRRQYFRTVDDLVLGVASGIADLNKLGPQAYGLVKQLGLSFGLR